jgi:signal peptidase II
MLIPHMTTKELLYDWAGVNVWLFHAINAQQPSWLDDAMSLATRLGDYRNFPLCLVVWLLAVWQWRRLGNTERTMRAWLQAQRFALGALLALLLTSSLKFGFDFPRPIAVLGSGVVRVLGSPEGHYGLPSGHSTFVMLLAVSLWPLFAWPYRLGLVALVLWVGVSRVWLGAHFPVDVLAGYVTGLISAYFAARIVRNRAPPVADTADAPDAQ